MTSENMRLRTENTGNSPFLLKPAGKDYLWGGTRLNDDFSKEIDLDPLQRPGNVQHIRTAPALWQAALSPGVCSRRC